MIYKFVVIDGCDSGAALFAIKADSEEEAKEQFVERGLPIAPHSFEYEDFVNMLKENDIQVEFLGADVETITL